MKQTNFQLPGQHITIRCSNQPLAQWLLEQQIAIPPETTRVAYACRASELGTMEIRMGWEEMQELKEFYIREALILLTPAEKQAALIAKLDSPEIQAGYRGTVSREIYVELPHGTGFATSWYEEQELVKYERCDDEGEILALVDHGHLKELRWERIPPIAHTIDAGAAVNCDHLREIRLDQVKRVEKNAFQRCSNLTRVVVGPNVTELCQGSFDRCEGLQEVDVSANPSLHWVTADYLRGGQAAQMLQTGDWLYEKALSPDGVTLTGSRKDEYTTLVIPEELDGRPVVELAEDAFIDKLFQKVVLPKTMQKAGDGSLYSPTLRQAQLYGEVEPDITGPFACEVGGCMLQKVEILPGSRRIADCLFEDLFGLQEVVLPDSLESIGDQAFCGCGSLKVIRFPAGLKTIGDSAFWDCDTLEEITLPNTLESIGAEAFGDCDALRVVRLPRGCQVAPDAFDDCDPQLELCYWDEELQPEPAAEPVPADRPRETVTERLLRYVQVTTTSAEGQTTCPSTAGQWVLARMLVEELKDLGAADARVDEQGYVYGHLPASAGCEAAPALGFLAHLDTAAFSAVSVQPQVIPDYDGGEVTLGESGRVLRPAEFPNLTQLSGRTLITTDGTTLLGADDKAGIAEIMTLVAQLTESKEPHGRLCLAFTPDEEIGAGADRFDLDAFGADFAYTVDGGQEGEIQYENFNACEAAFLIHGFDVHPGEAKNTMVNALLVATQCNGMLPAGETPRDTEGYEGFYHLEQLTGTIEQAELRYLVRDHSAGGFQARKNTLRQIAKLLNERYGDGTVELTLRDQYANMAEVIQDGNFHLIERAKGAAKKVGLEPKVVPIRGGTDGARLSFMGLPCPNLGTGGFAFHGPYEHITAQAMEQTVAFLAALVQSYTEPV